MSSRALDVEELLARGPMDESPELRLLFHRLNNQLGIILAHAELLESKATDNINRARAAQVVSSTLHLVGRLGFEELRVRENDAQLIVEAMEQETEVGRRRFHSVHFMTLPSA